MRSHWQDFKNKGAKMHRLLKFYEGLNNYVINGYWKVLINQRYIAVEMPETKEMYYVMVHTFEPVPKHFFLEILKGTMGLNYLADTINGEDMPIDAINRSQSIIIDFNDSLEFMPEKALEDIYIKHHFEMYETVGYPQVIYREKGFLPRHIDEAMTSDLATIFDALKEVPIEKLERIDAINEETRLETLFKKENQWVKENRKLSFKDETIDFSARAIEKLMSATAPVDTVWYMTSVFLDDIVDYTDDDEVVALIAYMGILDAQGTLMEETYFEDYRDELFLLKNLIIDAFKSSKTRPKAIIFSLRNLYIGAKDFLEALGIQVRYQPGDEFINTFSERIESDEFIDEDALDEEMFSDLLMMYFMKAKGIDLYAIEDLPEARLEELYDAFELVVNESMFDYEEKLLTIDPSKELSEEEKDALVLKCITDRIDETVRP